MLVHAVAICSLIARSPRNDLFSVSIIQLYVSLLVMTLLDCDDGAPLGPLWVADQQ